MAMMAVWSLVGVAVAYKSSNFNIYRDVATWTNAHNGSLPGANQVLAHGEAGSYADFTAPSLWIYRTLFVTAGDRFQRSVWVLYEFAIFAIGLAIWIFRGMSLGLSKLQVRWTALLVASPIVSAWSLTFFEDKAIFFTLPVVALLIGRSIWSRAIVLGACAAWSGETYLTLALIPVLLVAGDELPGALASSRFWMKAVGSTLVGLAVAAGLTFSSGRTATTLLHDRANRESVRPFWFSIWRLTAPFWSARFRDAVAVLLALGIIALAYSVRLTFAEAFVALCALTLIMSNSTVEGRLIGLAPLGVILFRSSRLWGWYLTATAIWGSIFLVALMSHLYRATVFLAVSPIGHSPSVLAQVLVTNVIMLVCVIRAFQLGLGSRDASRDRPLMAV